MTTTNDSTRASFSFSDTWRYIPVDKEGNPNEEDHRVKRIRNFGEWAYQTQYLPGRQEYGPEFVGDPLEHLETEVADIITYVTFAKDRHKQMERELFLMRSIAIPLLREIINNNYIETNWNGIKDRVRTALHQSDMFSGGPPSPIQA